MHVTVRLFAGLRERAGAASFAIELPDGARVADALQRVADITEGVSVVAAVNREYADAEQTLHAGDELALIPPVSGGADEPAVGAVHVAISAQPLSLDGLLARVRDPRAGAIVTFSGVTREVPALQYEAYEEMAVAQITRIARSALARHGLCAVAVEHRTGTVALSEASVLIAVSAPHRGEAFAGGREVIDRIKELAPIWKKEEGEWVTGTRPAPDPAPSRPSG